jgi:stage II sporulation protein D
MQLSLEPKVPVRLKRLRLGLLVGLLIIGSNCGRRERMPPYPAPPPVTVAKPVAERPAIIRILLAEAFNSVSVKAARRSEELRVYVVDGQLQLQSVTGKTEQILEIGSGFRLEPAAGRFLELGDRRYRGVMDVFINPVGIPVAVNELEIEEYLRGVVPNELGPRKFPQLEAQKVQAVAARTFAFRSLGGNARFGFDLYSDERSQAYTGVVSEEPLSDRGIRDTRGVVAMFEGEPIWALYSSTCGGRTEAFHEIFKGAPIEYLMGGAICHDEASPYHSWEERIDMRKVQSSLDRYAGVGRLKHLDPLRRSEAGRVVEMRFTGDEGEKVLKGNEIRFALELRSNFLTAIRPIEDSSGLIRELLVRGKGWGHGVGLCQVGSVDLAEKGERYDDILKYYYKGVYLSYIQ